MPFLNFFFTSDYGTDLIYIERMMRKITDIMKNRVMKARCNTLRMYPIGFRNPLLIRDECYTDTSDTR